MKKTGSVALLSGGLDSLVSLAAALKRTRVRLCLTFDYGQKAAKREMSAARKICGYYGLRHAAAQLPWYRGLSSGALVDGKSRVPRMRTGRLDDISAATAGAAKVWVPARNAVFISIAAAFAESMGCGLVVTGFNAEEGRTFPDNTPEFARRMTSALALATMNGVKVTSFTQGLNKAQIALLGLKLRAPLNYAWSCYLGGAKPCGKCESCARSMRAFKHCNL